LIPVLEIGVERNCDDERENGNEQSDKYTAHSSSPQFRPIAASQASHPVMAFITLETLRT
jgi:hypothetical protein